MADKKGPAALDAVDNHYTSPESAATLTGSTSPGVKRIEALSQHINLTARVILFIGIFIVAYVYSLDISLRYAYQPVATDSFQTHSLLATISVLRSVIAAAAQPTSAKIADVFGRIELLAVSIVFYVVGTIVDATSTGVATYSAGAVLYQVGFTCVSFLVEVILSDVTTLRSRLLYSYVPVSPFLINAWVSGNVTSASLSGIGWRWGIGMWAIIYPVSLMPLILAIWLAHRRAKAAGALHDYKTPYQLFGATKLVKALFWQLDVAGMLLLIAVLSLVLVPLTLAGGVSSNWHQAHIVAPLVLGVFCIPAFVFWETKAPHPMLPFHLLKDRMVWGALGIITFMNCAASVQGDYLYTVLIISFNQSVLTATRIVNIYSFSACLMGILCGFIVYKTRRMKWMIVAGSCLHLVAFGLLIQFRGGDGANFPGMVVAQVLLGVACGMFTYAALASAQAATRHEHLAVMTGAYFACFNVGGAVGNAISGAIWTQLLPGQLLRDIGNSTVAEAVYAAPFTAIEDYPWDSPVRDGIVTSYRHVQKILCITGICKATLVLFCALVLRDPELPDLQSIAGAEVKNKQNAPKIDSTT